jgi:hypothetical protein
MSALSKSLAPSIAVAALVLIPLCSYGAGYLWLGKKGMLGDGLTVVRVYDSAYVAAVYKPAAAIESWATGANVKTSYYGN